MNARCAGTTIPHGKVGQVFGQAGVAEDLFVLVVVTSADGQSALEAFPQAALIAEALGGAEDGAVVAADLRHALHERLFLAA
ncbi:hypothetical protein [Methylogaea oryzae]|uniref:hypothetical protein n=1 Tax=Methylogaea oryzae TaxID=1295382 RepID=UPI0020D12BFD|nr:hypothetical protein [Methylogaea oryzae]